MKKITELESAISAVDRELLEILKRRFGMARQLADLKRGSGQSPDHLDRLGQHITQLLKINDGVVPASVLRAVFREIWSGAVALQEPVKVAFLGPVATFTHQAALATFGSAVTYVDQPTIADVFDAVSRREATYGVVPVENSTEGSVTHTLDMFADTDLNIYAELNLPIHHSLLSNCKPADITTVYSHPQVFGQCRRWLHRNLPRAKLVEVASTTEAAGRCSREANTGALASALAAQQYNVPIQESNIEDASENTTRFFVLSKKKPEASGDDKTSLLLAIRHRVGALYESLLPFGKHGVNLTFIESRPSKRRSWEYFFFIDFVGHVSDPHVQQVLNDLAETCQFVKILGSYPRAPESEG